MLFLLFQIDQDRYAIPAHRIVEILPLVKLKDFLQVPAGISGLFNYRGTLVPVIDLNVMTRGYPATRRLSTRIILVESTFDGERNRMLGLISEHVTETVQLTAEAFSETGVASAGAPYLGRVTSPAGSFVQWREIEKLLTPAIRA